MHVLITDNDLGDSQLEKEILERELAASVSIATCRSESDVIEVVRRERPDAILVQWAPITAAVLDAAPECRVVSRMGIGIDMIDAVAADTRGVSVRNVPHYCVEEVATHALALALSLWRRLPQLDREIRAGRWDAAATAPRIRRLSASTIGLIGLGRIGRKVADAFSALGATIIVADPALGTDSYPRVTVEDIASRADIISLHAPLIDATRAVVGADFLSRTRRQPIIINTSRGGLIDIPALVSALDEGRVAGAGLDVFDVEPLPMDAALRSVDNVILTPHAAWCSAAALPALRTQAAGNIVDFFTLP